MRLPARLVTMLSLMALSSSIVAGESDALSFATPVGGEPAIEVAGILSELTPVPHEIDVDLLSTGVGNQLICMHLVDATPATQREAVAIALGCWWVRLPGVRESIRYTRSRRLPLGPLGVHWTTSGVINRSDVETLVHDLLTPWLSGSAGLAYQADDGTWPATLDDAGQARLVEVLGVIEHSQARCPDLIPDPEDPDLERELGVPVRGGTWDGLMHHLAQAAHLSVVLGPGLSPQGQAPEDLPAGTIRQALDVLSAQGIDVGVVHGVIGLSREPVTPRHHPAQTRHLAAAPIGHLLHTADDGDLLQVALTRSVEPSCWSLPGWGMHYLAQQRILLIAADQPTIHHVLDALAVVDQLGLDQGLASLATVTPAGRH